MPMESSSSVMPFGAPSRSRSRRSRSRWKQARTRGASLEKSASVISPRTRSAGKAGSAFRKAATSSGGRPNWRASPDLQPPLQRLGDAERIERLELGGKARLQLRLVGLQMPDHRPVEIAKILHGLPFSIRLLRLVFAKLAAARSIGEAKARLGF